MAAMLKASFLAMGAIVAGTAFAADLPSPVHKAPQAAPVYHWGGLYAGLHAGYGWSRSASTLGGLINGVPTPFDDEIPASYRISSEGFIGGGQLGYNLQINRAVFGIEGDVSYSGVDGGTTIAGSVTSGGPPVTQNFISARSQELTWLATLRGRLGYAPSDALLVYATGGLAVGHVEDSMRLAFLGVGGATFAGSATSTRSGWTAGGGAEYRIFGNFPAKLEYLYFDLGKSSFVGLDVVFPNQPFQSRSEFDHNGHIVRVGLNYKFGDGPVIAK